MACSFPPQRLFLDLIASGLHPKVCAGIIAPFCMLYSDQAQLRVEGTGRSFNITVKYPFHYDNTTAAYTEEDVPPNFSFDPALEIIVQVFVVTATVTGGVALLVTLLSCSTGGSAKAKKFMIAVSTVQPQGLCRGRRGALATHSVHKVFCSQRTFKKFSLRKNWKGPRNFWNIPDSWNNISQGYCACCCSNLDSRCTSPYNCPDVSWITGNIHRGHYGLCTGCFNQLVVVQPAGSMQGSQQRNGVHHHVHNGRHILPKIHLRWVPSWLHLVVCVCGELEFIS